MKHTGHNLNLHTDIYQKQSSLIEKTKIAKLLIALEEGSLSRFAGKYIADIPETGKYKTDICKNLSNNSMSKT